MDIYTMGFTQKREEQFFELILRNKIEILVDVRLNNQSQLAGFTKGKDLAEVLRKNFTTQEILQYILQYDIS